MDPDPNNYLTFLFINPNWSANLGLVIILFIVILVMLIISTITSAAENAFFSLNPSDIAELKEDEKNRLSLP